MKAARRFDADTIAQIRERKLKTPKRSRRLPRPLKPAFPHGAQRQYQRELSGFVAEAKAITKRAILPNLPSLISEINSKVPSRVRQDDMIDDLAALIAEARARLGVLFTDSMISAIASRMGSAVESVMRGNESRQRDSLIPFNIRLGSGALTSEVRDYLRLRVSENVQLIKTLADRHFGKLQTEIMQAITQGKRVEDIESVIDDQFASMDSNAELIARDQVGKINGQLTEISQVGLGITHYRWRGVGDERERSSHRDLEGEIYSWNSPPIVDGEAVHPGEAIQCRCYAEPVIDDFAE